MVAASTIKPGIEAIKKLKNFKVYKNVSEGLNLFQQKRSMPPSTTATAPSR